MRRAALFACLLLASAAHAGAAHAGSHADAHADTHADSRAKDEGATNAFSPKRGATELVVATVAAATQSVCVAAYSFTSAPIAEALLAAKARGVAVRVTLDKSQSRGKSSILPQLQQSGLPVRINRHYAIMHDKFMVIDDKVLQLGSFNYTKAAETRNAENVLVIRRYKKVIAAYAAECDRLWDEAVEPAALTAPVIAAPAVNAPLVNAPAATTPGAQAAALPTLPAPAPARPKRKARSKPKPQSDLSDPPVISFP